MLFKPELAEKVMKQEKTQTRRLVKPDELFHAGFGWVLIDRHGGRLKWAIGETYAVCPGRGKFAIGRIKILDIRSEDVRNISEEDAIAEGFTCRPEFWQVWCSMHDPALLNTPTCLFIYGPLYQEAIDNIWLHHMKERPDERYQAWALTFELAWAD